MIGFVYVGAIREQNFHKCSVALKNKMYTEDVKINVCFFDG